jgi:endonuclease G
MKKWIASAALVLAVGFAPAVQAASSPCPQFHPSGIAPEFANPKLAVKTRELCFSDFDVMHSGVTRTPLWSAEYLTADKLRAAREESRTNDFHPETRLPPDERAELDDYRKSGYDRGHQSPAGDRPTDAAMEDSFSLSNMVPQAPRNNRGVWAHIEGYVRHLALTNGTEYIVTGPLFQGRQLQQLKGRVMVPTSLFKVVYLPGPGRAFVFVAANTDEDNWGTMSVAQFEQMSGLVFPGIPAQLKNQQPPRVSLK